MADLTQGLPAAARARPPSSTAGVVGWLRANLFGGVFNTVLTVACAALLALAIPPVVRWALIDAIWHAPDGAACRGGGACWAFVGEKLRFILFGFFPSDQMWRPIVVVLIFLAMILAACSRRLLGQRRPLSLRGTLILMAAASPVTLFLTVLLLDAVTGGQVTLFTPAYDATWLVRKIVMLLAVSVGASGMGYLLCWLWGRWLLLIWLFGLLFAYLLMHGGFLGLSTVETRLWSGLPLTLIIAVVGMVLAFPLAILLALGRRSQLPAVRAICVGYIELIRGVPLITVLFMASLMLPLFLPTGMTIDKLVRAQVAFILFAAAYLAEVIRGGLQAIPRGQVEAADALGLSYFQRTRLIVLPQALSLVIPPLVNTFIGIFKDTTLVIIISLFDLLGTAEAALSDVNWQGFYVEDYVFIALIYFCFCFFMSRYSQALEHDLHRGARR